MFRALAGVAVSALVLGAAPAAGAPRGHWKPAALARDVVTANLKRASPGATPSLDPARCSGQATVAHCTVTASVAGDGVTARVTFTRRRDGTHVRYVDTLTLVPATGGATVTRTYYGRILT